MDKSVWKVIKALEAYMDDQKNFKKAAKVADLFGKLDGAQANDLNDWLSEIENLVLSLCVVGTIAKKNSNHQRPLAAH